MDDTSARNCGAVSWAPLDITTRMPVSDDVRCRIETIVRGMHAAAALPRQQSEMAKKRRASSGSDTQG